MYCFDLGLLSSHEWRVTHALSHHIFPNTILDFEISNLEPLLDYRVYKSKSFLHRTKLSFFIALILSPLALFMEVVKRSISIAAGQQKIRMENFTPAIPLTVFMIAIPSSSADYWWLAFKLWTVMNSAYAIFFVLIGLTTAHYHPDMFHAGDGEFRYGLDWGLTQLDATGDSKDVTGFLLAELCTFGNHVLHHLFPTLDHGLLDSLRPVLQKTVEDFHLPDDVIQSLNNKFTQRELLIGSLQQLARTKPRVLDPNQ